MTVLIPDDSMPKWPVVHEPTHEEMQTSVSRFIKKIIQVVKVVPRIERIFREEREKKIALIKKEMDEAETSGGGGGAARFGAAKPGAASGREGGNYQKLMSLSLNMKIESKKTREFIKAQTTSLKVLKVSLRT